MAVAHMTPVDAGLWWGDVAKDEEDDGEMRDNQPNPPAVYAEGQGLVPPAPEGAVCRFVESAFWHGALFLYVGRFQASMTGVGRHLFGERSQPLCERFRAERPPREGKLKYLPWRTRSQRELAFAQGILDGLDPWGVRRTSLRD